MKPIYYAYFAVVLNATIVGFSFLFTKIAIEEASPVEALSYRFTIAWTALTIFLILTKKKINLSFHNGQLNFSLFALALFYPILFFSFQAFGLNFTTSAEGGIIFAFTPALTALLAALFLKEQLTKTQYGFIFLSISGVLLISWMSGTSLSFTKYNMIGLLFLLISSLSISGYNVLARYLSVSFSPLQLTYIMVTFGFIFFNAYAIIQNLILGSILNYFRLFYQNTAFFISVLFLGILATLLTSYLANYALSKLAASKVSVFSNFSTIISILAGVFVLNESIFIYHIIGAVMILLGVTGTNITRPMKAKKKDNHQKKLNV